MRRATAISGSARSSAARAGSGCSIATARSTSSATGSASSRRSRRTTRCSRSRGAAFSAWSAWLYLALNLVFALLFVACGPDALAGPGAHMLGGRFSQAFFFSIQTFATIGYGQIGAQRARRQHCW